jgi:5-methylcytosine-specific restriction endonuclease McrA
MTEVECEYCGELFDEQGLATHKHYCDEAPDEDESEPMADYSELEREALDRDDGACVRCKAEAELTVHTVDPDVGEQLSNLMTLCVECEEEVSGLHPRTKRTKADELS